MVLWKARSLSPEQKVQIVEEESETKSLQTEENGSFLGLEDVNMSEVYSSVLSVPVSSLSVPNCMHMHAFMCTWASCIYIVDLFILVCTFCKSICFYLTVNTVSDHFLNRAVWGG